MQMVVRSLRTVRARSGTVAVLLATAGVLLAGDAPVRGVRVDYPDRRTDVLGSQFAAVDPLPGQTGDDQTGDDGTGADRREAGPARVSDPPMWSVTLPDRVVPTDVVPTEPGLVMTSRDQVVLVGYDGTRLWEHRLPDSRTRVKAGSEVVLVGQEHPTDDRWPQPKVVTAMDTATGEILWEEDEASFWTAVEGTVYMSVCYGGQHGRIGDCQFSARDLLTNTVRWSVPTYASAQVVNDGRDSSIWPEPPYLVLESYPTGRASRTITTFDPRTGRQLAAGFEGLASATATANTLVSVFDHDENPADGCTATLTGYSVSSGEQVWNRTVPTATDSEGLSCQRLPDRRAGSGQLAVTTDQGTPAVIDPDSGEVVWSAPDPGVGLAATDTHLVALEANPEGNQIVLYELAGERRLWSAPAAAAEPEFTAHIYDQTVLAIGTGLWTAAPNGYDLATGAGWTYLDHTSGDERPHLGPSWVVVCDRNVCRGYDLP